MNKRGTRTKQRGNFFYSIASRIALSRFQSAFKRVHSVNIEDFFLQLCVLLFLCLHLIEQSVSNRFLFLFLNRIPAARGMRHSGSRSMAVSHPGKLCHALNLCTISVGCQSSDRSGSHHHGDWLSGMCRSSQGKSATATQRKYRLRNPFTLTSVLVMMPDLFSQTSACTEHRRY